MSFVLYLYRSRGIKRRFSDPLKQFATLLRLGQYLNTEAGIVMIFVYEKVPLQLANFEFFSNILSGIILKLSDCLNVLLHETILP